jgi:hypothetical protein
MIVALAGARGLGEPRSVGGGFVRGRDVEELAVLGAADVLDGQGMGELEGVLAKDRRNGQ